jgi:NTE family protein
MLSGSGKRVKVGLALGGGVARGLAHIGAVAALQEAGVPIDYVAGSSAGALVGAFVRAGWNPGALFSAASGLNWLRLLRPTWPRRGFFTFDLLAGWLKGLLGDVDIADLSKPLLVVATDLATGEPVRFTHGQLARVVQASCCVPFFIRPVQIDGRWLADGSLSDSIPVQALREMGADYVIGVNVFPPKIRAWMGPLGMGFAALESLVQRAGGGVDAADCRITAVLGGETYLRFSRRQALFDQGYAAASAALDQIRRDVTGRTDSSRTDGLDEFNPADNLVDEVAAG